MSVLYVSEIFCSLQGEGYFLGRKTVFVRMANCSLKCSFCDTAYAQSKEKAIQFSPEDLQEYILQLANETDTRRVCITGGEPTESDPDSMLKLVVGLRKKHLHLQVETNGTNLDVPWLKEVHWITVSPKRKDSEAFTRCYVYPVSELKFVLGPGEEIPQFHGRPISCCIMPLTKRVFDRNGDRVEDFQEALEFNFKSYKWAAKKVFESKDRWRLTCRLQELASIR